MMELFFFVYVHFTVYCTNEATKLLQLVPTVTVQMECVIQIFVYNVKSMPVKDVKEKAIAWEKEMFHGST